MSLQDDARPDWARLAAIPDLEARLMAIQDAIEQHSELLEKLTGFMSENRPTFREIMDAVCEYYDVTPADICSEKRFLIVAQPRLIVYYLARRLTRLSLHGIADRLGFRDHATIYSGIKRITYRLHHDEILRDDIDVLRSRIAEKVLLRPGKIAS